MQEVTVDTGGYTGYRRLQGIQEVTGHTWDDRGTRGSRGYRGLQGIQEVTGDTSDTGCDRGYRR